MLGRRFTVPGYRVRTDLVELDELQRRVGCDVAAVPPEVAVLAWDADARRWLAHLGGAAAVRYRLPATLRFLDRQVRPRLAAGSFWLAVCLWDGWRERDRPDAPPPAPLSSSQPRVFAFAGRRGDPTVALLPEAHYLERFHYARFRFRARVVPDPWRTTAPTAIYCGGRNGRPIGGVPGDPGPIAREVLAEVVASRGLDVRVHLGQGVSLREQRRHRYLIDVDGFVRTYDAWAWKVLSGCLVLSQASPWDTFFTREFEPWTHFVPVAEDFSDLGERLEWCRSNDAECHAVAQRARHRALEVYDPDLVAERVAASVASSTRRS